MGTKIIHIYEIVKRVCATTFSDGRLRRIAPYDVTANCERMAVGLPPPTLLLHAPMYGF